MKGHTLYTHSKKLLADTLTPVNIYLKLRDVYAGSILLESSDYHGHENSRSFICCHPIASFEVSDNTIRTSGVSGLVAKNTIAGRQEVLARLEAFRSQFIVEGNPAGHPPGGLFGYMTFDAVRYFDDAPVRVTERVIPEMLYKVYRFVIVIDHFSNELILTEHVLSPDAPSGLPALEKVIFSNRFSTFPFRKEGSEASNLTDEEYMDIVRKGIGHCHRGDVFQIVLSRRFTAGFRGDEFNVYRALRSINPSPYLFYFDYGGFKIFGSSPEAQLRIEGAKAAIFPIAGTFRRTGNDVEDAALAEKLAKDEKENAEHIMLVDLARNDLSRTADQVEVEVFKEIQYYSHVIHLVSKVTGKIRDGQSKLKLVSDTFPAGTLAGAPKHKAISLISELEKVNRGFYGGAIGFMGFNGDFNHAIMIRTFLSRHNRLTYQAGAGIVAKSQPENELEEVNNKMGALRRAIDLAESL